MEWQLQSLSRHCAVCNEPLRAGDHVISIVFKRTGADIERADIREENLEKFTLPGIELGRWTRVVKERAEEEREARIQLLATREEFFLSLYSSPEDPTGDKAVLKQLTALMLERKRILRAIGKPANNIQRYLHTRTKDEYEVPTSDLQLEQLAAVQNALEVLVA